MRSPPTHTELCMLARGELDMFEASETVKSLPGASVATRAIAEEFSVGTMLARVVRELDLVADLRQIMWSTRKPWGVGGTSTNKAEVAAGTDTAATDAGKDSTDTTAPASAASTSAASGATPYTFTSPFNIIASVVSFLPSVKDVCAASAVCTAWRGPASDDTVWRPLLERDFGIPAADTDGGTALATPSGPAAAAAAAASNLTIKSLYAELMRARARRAAGIPGTTFRVRLPAKDGEVWPHLFPGPDPKLLVARNAGGSAQLTVFNLLDSAAAVPLSSAAIGAGAADAGGESIAPMVDWPASVWDADDDDEPALASPITCCVQQWVKRKRGKQQHGQECAGRLLILTGHANGQLHCWDAKDGTRQWSGTPRGVGQGGVQCIYTSAGGFVYTSYAPPSSSATLGAAARGGEGESTVATAAGSKPAASPPATVLQWPLEGSAASDGAGAACSISATVEIAGIPKNNVSCIASNDTVVVASSTATTHGTSMTHPLRFGLTQGHCWETAESVTESAAPHQ